MVKAPSQGLVHYTVRQEAIPQRRVLAAPTIESGGTVGGKVSAGSPTCSMKTDLVEHPGDVDDSACTVVRPARHCPRICLFHVLPGPRLSRRCGGRKRDHWPGR
jgi:hypothetical protein